MSMFGRQHFVILLLAAAEKLFVAKIPDVSGYSSSLLASPGSPDRVGGFGGLPGRARDTDRTLRRSVHVLRHACLAGLGRLGRRSGRERVFGASRALESPKTAAEVSHQLGAGGGMHRRRDRRRQEGRHFLGALGEAVAEPIGVTVLRGESESPGGAQGVKMTHRELQDVRLLQLRHVLALGLQGRHHQILQLVQAAIDPGAPLTLQHRLHHLAILVGPRHRLLVFHAADGGVTRVRRHDRTPLSVVFITGHRTRDN